MLSYHHLTDPQPMTGNTFALVLALKAPRVSLKFMSSTNSHWHYFNNSSYCVGKETFYSGFTLSCSTFQESSLNMQVSCVFFPVCHNTWCCG